MKNITTKLKEIYFPFLMVALGTIFFYNLLRWTLDIKLGILPLKENLLSFWIPFILPWITIYIWLRKRVRILNIKRKNDNGYFGYQFVMALAIIIPLIISQNYLEKSAFNLNEIETISEIKELKNEKYFKIKTFKINHYSSLPFVTTRTTGRNNNYLNFYLYLSCPFEQTTAVWYGVKYSNKISNREHEENINAEYNRFINASENEFKSYNFNAVTYFEKLGYSDDRNGFLEAIEKKNPSINKKEQIILIPKKDNFENRLGNSFPWIFGSFTIGALLVLAMVLIPNIDDRQLRTFKKNKPLQDDDVKDVLRLLNPMGENKAMAILVLLNGIVFIIMILSGLNIISPTPKELLDIGGNRRLEVLNGEYWRLFTSTFIHSGIVHLLMNILGLGVGCYALEKVLGAFKLITIYFICGILASLASIYWHENTVSIGASGAIFGLYGLILAFNIFKIYPNYMRGYTWLLLGLYAGLSLIFGFLGGIDNAAHIGGLISGFIIGVIMVSLNKEQLKKNAE